MKNNNLKLPLSIARLVAMCIIMLSLLSCESGKQDLIPLYDGDTYLFFNDKGEIAVKPEINVGLVTPFSEGLVMAGIKTDEGERFGFFNMKGEFVIRPQYLYATPFFEGLAWVVEPNGAPKAINKHQEEILSIPDAEVVMQFSEGVAGFSKKDQEGRLRYGFIDKKGNIVIEPLYDRVDPFYNGLATVEKDAKKGYINRKGDIEIPLQFVFAGPFSDRGFALAATSVNHMGVIDKKGSFIINPKYADIIIDGNEFIVKENDKYGIIDKDANVIIPIDFKYISRFNGNPYTMASLDGKSFGIIDRKGKFKVNPQFNFGTSFTGNLAVVASDGSIGLVDTNGKYIVNPQYKDFAMQQLGFINIYMVQSDFFDMDGTVAALVDYDQGEYGFRYISPSSKYSDVKGRFPYLSASYYSSKHTSTEEREISKDRNIYMTSVTFTFDGPISKREYDYYERKYTTVDLDPSVKTAEYNIAFRHERAGKKIAEIAKAVDQALKSRYTDSNVKVSAIRSGNNIKINFSYN